MALDGSLREELVEARRGLIAQIDALWLRRMTMGNPHGGGGPPDLESISTQLEGQLAEINALLGYDARDATRY